MVNLITNSDDFGLTDSITDAIVDTHLNGIMTSTTMMVNMPGFEYAVKKAKEISSLGVGIHFNLTEGIPLATPNQIPDLIDNSGKFLNNAAQRKNLIYGKHLYNQAKIELTLQLEKLLDNGVKPTHFDSHHHITGVPCAFNASLNVAKKFGINRARITNIYPVFTKESKLSFWRQMVEQLKVFPKALIHLRNKKTLIKHKFITPNTKILPSKVIPNNMLLDPVKHFISVLSILKNGVTEISFHPGYENSDPNDSIKTAEIRTRDLLIANSSEVKTYIKENNINLISFKNL